jgi:hypothetical protein
VKLKNETRNLDSFFICQKQGVDHTRQTKQPPHHSPHTHTSFYGTLRGQARCHERSEARVIGLAHRYVVRRRLVASLRACTKQHTAPPSFSTTYNIATLTDTNNTHRTLFSAA